MEVQFNTKHNIVQEGLQQFKEGKKSCPTVYFRNMLNAKQQRDQQSEEHIDYLETIRCGKMMNQQKKYSKSTSKNSQACYRKQFGYKRLSSDEQQQQTNDWYTNLMKNRIKQDKENIAPNMQNENTSNNSRYTDQGQIQLKYGTVQDKEDSNSQQQQQQNDGQKYALLQNNEYQQKNQGCQHPQQRQEKYVPKVLRNRSLLQNNNNNNIKVFQNIINYNIFKEDAFKDTQHIVPKTGNKLSLEEIFQKFQSLQERTLAYKCHEYQRLIARENSMLCNNVNGHKPKKKYFRYGIGVLILSIILMVSFFMGDSNQDYKEEERKVYDQDILQQQWQEKTNQGKLNKTDEEYYEKLEKRNEILIKSMAMYKDIYEYQLKINKLQNDNKEI